jgi:hypothetical protein
VSKKCSSVCKLPLGTVVRSAGVRQLQLRGACEHVPSLGTCAARHSTCLTTQAQGEAL